MKVVKKTHVKKFWEIENRPDVIYAELDRLGLIKGHPKNYKWDVAQQMPCTRTGILLRFIPAGEGHISE